MNVRRLFSLTPAELNLFARLRLLAGAALVALGLVILFFPQILVVALSALVTTAGVGLLASGWRMRRRARSKDVVEVVRW